MYVFLCLSEQTFARLISACVRVCVIADVRRVDTGEVRGECTHRYIYIYSVGLNDNYTRERIHQNLCSHSLCCIMPQYVNHRRFYLSPHNAGHVCNVVMLCLPNDVWLSSAIPRNIQCDNTPHAYGNIDWKHYQRWRTNAAYDLIHCGLCCSISVRKLLADLRTARPHSMVITLINQ